MEKYSIKDVLLDIRIISRALSYLKDFDISNTSEIREDDEGDIKEYIDYELSISMKEFFLKYSFGENKDEEFTFYDDPGCAIDRIITEIEFFMYSISEKDRAIFVERLQYYFSMELGGFEDGMKVAMLLMRIYDDSACVIRPKADLLLSGLMYMKSMFRCLNELLVCMGYKDFETKSTPIECNINQYLICESKETGRDLLTKHLLNKKGKAISIAIQALMRAKILVPSSVVSRSAIYREIRVFLGASIGTSAAINNYWNEVNDEVDKLAKQIRKEL